MHNEITYLVTQHVDSFNLAALNIFCLPSSTTLPPINDSTLQTYLTLFPKTVSFKDTKSFYYWCATLI